jgi:hypothetical protein
LQPYVDMFKVGELLEKLCKGREFNVTATGKLVSTQEACYYVRSLVIQGWLGGEVEGLLCSQFEAGKVVV